MKTVSLRKRFFTNTTIIGVVVMLISALIVDISYREELEKSSREKLHLHIFTLLSVAHTEQGELLIPDILYNPRFNTIDSGLWAVVLNDQKQAVWNSLSIEKAPDNISLSLKTGDIIFGNMQIDEQEYITAAYKIAWEEGGERYSFHFVTAEDASILNNTISHFRFWLFSGFFVITLTLLLCQLFVLKLAFRPISHLENEIILLEKGKQNTLSMDYPRELSGVAESLNALIANEHRQRERYRSSMADLAHSLKTPMTIIASEMKNYPENKILKDATKRIDKNIEYQLRRAVISGHTLLNYGTNIVEVLDLVQEALSKIYRDKKISLSTKVEGNLYFFGDENDLMEVFGNLLDNAYKYAIEKIKVSVAQCDNYLSISIEDDGKGFIGDQASKIFTRGERLDSRGKGQGIGLAVVFDIVQSYQGTIEAVTSSLGGAEFRIIFPLKQKK
ncbi:ATP-binding protein [Agarilytica rhodophyticola]|uniref:ATP-binding protein n=1 Tax=Agarilytica rhodophyticola TaxID=1737490 RepID=UPI000B344B8E|nr:ATP-binding protein [Agarilytica rhodophyticola]